MNDLELADILEKAERLIRAGWTQKTVARNRHGITVEALSCDATQFCAGGAIVRAVKDSTPGINTGAEISNLPIFLRALNAMRPETGESIVVWNDKPRQTQGKVANAFRKAARKARRAS